MDDLVATFDLRVTIRILVVTDGPIDLWDTPTEPEPIRLNEGFTLREMARALWDAPESNYPWTRFAFDHAIHGSGPMTSETRNETDPETGLRRTWVQHSNFRFDEPGFPLHLFDQVWLFGFWPGNPVPDPVLVTTYETPANRAPLSRSELRKLNSWMNAGGGVFATGDHGLLGTHLAGDVPRVSAMRRWHHRGLSDDVPSVNQVDRIDTTVPVMNVGGQPVARFEDQSDDVPKRLSLKWYELWDHLVSVGGRRPLAQRRAPHSILCTPLGPINIHPDHMHEGRVREDEEVQLEGADYLGAPLFPGGRQRPRPEAIAWATVRGGDVLYDDLQAQGEPLQHGSKSVLHRVVPAISVYDGERAGVGRVVVDSSFHNWIDINLRGTGARRTGLLGKHLELMHYYVRNIAQWLATPEQREAMRHGLFFHAVASTGGWAELLHDSVAIGERARDVLGQVASPCERNAFVFDPWWTQVDLSVVLAATKSRTLALPSEEHLSHHVLGAMAEAVFDIMPALERLSEGDRADDGRFGCAVPALIDRLADAKRAGLQTAFTEWRESLRATELFLDSIEASVAEPCRTDVEFVAIVPQSDGPERPEPGTG